MFEAVSVTVQDTMSQAAITGGWLKILQAALTTLLGEGN